MDDQQLPAQTNTIDTCRYNLHFPSNVSPTVLANTIPDLLTFVASLSSNYIWHKQPFSLQLSAASFSSATKQQYLEGKTDCTDCVDDEWFIVWLLREMTRNWKNAVISVSDEDGEFLLIEGAEVLPKWVTPQNAENRVWLYQERLHLVPLEHKSAMPFEGESTANPSFDPEEEGFIDQSAAIELVRNAAVDTFAPVELEKIVFDRINGYPGKIAEHLHRTLAYLPADIALALADTPSLASEAIAAFYEREPASLRACNTMTRFPPSSPSSSFDNSADLPATVFIPTTLTRPLYSQLVLQRFFPPKPFEKVGWMDGAAGIGAEEERRRSVGMKLACGFEMLYKLSSPQIRVDVAGFDATDSKYRAFIKRLEASGYFEGEIEGSKKWSEREKIAREGWSAANKSGRQEKSFAQRVDEAIARSKTLIPLLPTRITSRLPPSEALKIEDSEAWLSLDEQGFEEMLQSRGPGMGGLDDLDDEEFSSDEDADDAMEGVEESKDSMERKEERKAKKIAKQMEGMAEKVEEFVQGRGAVDGAEFSDEQSSDEDEEDYPELSPEERRLRTEKLVAPLADEDWGKKESTLPPPLAPPEIPSIPLPPREPKLTENKYDGASSDDDSSEEEVEDEAGLGEEEGEDGPNVEGEDLDMEEEMDEFLKFATETLGLSKEQYEKILGERAGRGAFVPGPPAAKKKNIIPTPPSKPAPASKSKAPVKLPPSTTIPTPEPVRQPLRNPNLTDFDALMEQMDVELHKSRAPKASTSSSTSAAIPSIPKATTTPKSKSKAKANPRAPASTNRIVMHDDPSSSEGEASGSDDEMESMDAELAELFKTAGGQGEDGEGTMDYNLVKNFLESFQSQGGFGGPAGNLSGRLGFKMPKNVE